MDGGDQAGQSPTLDNNLEGTTMEGTHMDAWIRRAAEYGLLEHEWRAAQAVAGMLAGAVAIATDSLERPSETAVLAVFHEMCTRADAPSEVPLRSVH
jgi:hypothetical protein